MCKKGKNPTRKGKIEAGDHIEDTIFKPSLPVNAFPLLDRLRELIKENNTNSLHLCKKDIRIEKTLWLILQQYFGDLAVIDLSEMWQFLKDKETC